MNLKEALTQQITVEEEIREYIRRFFSPYKGAGHETYSFVFSHAGVEVEMCKPHRREKLLCEELQNELDPVKVNMYYHTKTVNRDSVHNSSISPDQEDIDRFMERFDEDTLNFIGEACTVFIEFCTSCDEYLREGSFRDKWTTTAVAAFLNDKLDFGKVSNKDADSLIRESIVLNELARSREREYITYLINVSMLEAVTGTVTDKGKYFRKIMRENTVPWVIDEFRKVDDEDKEKLTDVLKEFTKVRKRGMRWPLKI